MICSNYYNFVPTKGTKTLPPETTFPGLKISPKCFCGRARPLNLCELIALPRPPSWIRGGRRIERKEGKRRGGEKRGRKGREVNNPKLKVWL